MAQLKSKLLNKTLGKFFSWTSVFAWIPYLYLISIGKDTPIWPFLIIHLVGIFSGAKLRGSLPEEQIAYGKRRRKISKILIYLGVMAWLPYYYLVNVAHQPTSIGPFLAAHLTGILGGALVRLSVSLGQSKQRKAEVLIKND